MLQWPFYKQQYLAFAVMYLSSYDFKSLLQLGLFLQNQDRLYVKKLDLLAKSSNLSYYIKKN